MTTAQMNPMKAAPMRAEPSLFTTNGRRKYLTLSERQRFIQVSLNQPPAVRRLCLTLLWSGGRLSEVLALKGNHICVDERTVLFRTLKQRGVCRFRSVPLPEAVLTELEETEEQLFPWARTQAWSIVSNTMTAAGISGPQACPRGLRHSFAVHAITSGVPLHLLQRWLGHSSLSSTAIYANVLGAEERTIAARMWRQ